MMGVMKNRGSVGGVVVAGLVGVVAGGLAVVDMVIAGLVMAAAEHERDLDAIEVEGVEVFDADRDHLPWYTNVALGHTLVGLAQAHPGVALLVLAGHCHGPADVPFLPNLRLVTGRALYGAPSVAGVHEIP